ncbi:MAG: helix-turn-helix transcriptional regulator, partial [Nitrospirota bacterium]|nr:helix-turn-helix transcriptional regulator [Nitrospirota bacterium]
MKRRDRNIIGENIRKLRMQTGLTQEELALKSGLSQGYVNQLENGKRKYTQKSLELIADALA